MPATVFYSWQSDSDKSGNRNFIEDALEKAIQRLNCKVDLQAAVRGEEITLDKDTQGVPGSPPIVDTILQKISQSSVFVPDLTFVGSSKAGRPLPNPNVLIEYGWALRVLGHGRIVPVMNGAAGEPSEDAMPFDMRHLRNPITYHLATTAGQDEKTREKSNLVAKFERALLAVLTKMPLENTEAKEFVGQPSTINASAFWRKEETFTGGGRFHTASQVLSMPVVPMMFLRIIPQEPLSSINTSKAALDLVQSGGLRPLSSHDIGGWSHERNRYGAFSVNNESGVIRHLSQLFKSGEIWGVDAWTLDPAIAAQYSKINFGFFPCSLFEETFVITLENYLKFAREVLKLPPPLKMLAGATDVKGFRMTAPRGMSFNYSPYAGNVVEEHILKETTIDDYDHDALYWLMPFFKYVWEECGLVRPDKPLLD